MTIGLVLLTDFLLPNMLSSHWRILKENLNVVWLSFGDGSGCYVAYSPQPSQTGHWWALWCENIQAGALECMSNGLLKVFAWLERVLASASFRDCEKPMLVLNDSLFKYPDWYVIHLQLPGEAWTWSLCWTSWKAPSQRWRRTSPALSWATRWRGSLRLDDTSPAGVLACAGGSTTAPRSPPNRFVCSSSKS